MITAACKRILEIVGPKPGLVIGLEGLEYSGKSTTVGLIERGFQQALGVASSLALSDLDRELPLSKSIFSTVVRDGFSYPDSLSRYRSVDLLVKAMSLARDEAYQVNALPMLNQHGIAIIDRSPVTTTVYQLFMRPYFLEALSAETGVCSQELHDWLVKYIRRINTFSIGHWDEVKVYSVTALTLDKDEVQKRADSRPEKRELFDEWVSNAFEHMNEAMVQTLALWREASAGPGSVEVSDTPFARAFREAQEGMNPPCHFLNSFDVTGMNETEVAYRVLDNLADTLERGV